MQWPGWKARCVRGLVASLVLAVAISMTSGGALAGDWQLRSSSRGVCSLQPSDSVPLLGQPLSKNATKREACEAARARREGTPDDAKKCAGYTPNTVKLCGSAGVDLGK